MTAPCQSTPTFITSIWALLLHRCHTLLFPTLFVELFIKIAVAMIAHVGLSAYKLFVVINVVRTVSKLARLNIFLRPVGVSLLMLLVVVVLVELVVAVSAAAVVVVWFMGLVVLVLVVLVVVVVVLRFVLSQVLVLVVVQCLQ